MDKWLVGMGLAFFLLKKVCNELQFKGTYMMRWQNE